VYPLDEDLVAATVVAFEVGVSDTDTDTGTGTGTSTGTAATSRDIVDYRQHDCDMMMTMMAVYSVNYFEIVECMIFALTDYDDNKDVDDDKHAE
jgi:hypothetical protein